jgi:hypothetical protein
MARDQRIIGREYISRTARLIAEERWKELADLTAKFTGIVTIWEINRVAAQERALKDGCSKQRVAFNKKLK